MVFKFRIFEIRNPAEFAHVVAANLYDCFLNTQVNRMGKAGETPGTINARLQPRFQIRILCQSHRLSSDFVSDYSKRSGLEIFGFSACDQLRSICLHDDKLQQHV